MNAPSSPWPRATDPPAHALPGEQTRPLIRCEYAHAMGESNGTLADTWAAIEATPGLQGGFIGEFRDHGILQRVNDGRPAGRGGAGLYDNGVTAPGPRRAYGGDVDGTIHDGAFVADPVVFPGRTPKPVMYEHREIAAPARLSVEGEGAWQVLRPVGHHSAAVDELFTPCLRPQESGGRHGVRHFTPSGAGHELSVRLDGPRQVSVNRYRAADLAAVGHHDEPVPRPGCVVHIHAAYRGLGTASCGPDTSPSYRVPPGVHRWSWTLRAR